MHVFCALIAIAGLAGAAFYAVGLATGHLHRAHLPTRPLVVGALAVTALLLVSRTTDALHAATSDDSTAIAAAPSPSSAGNVSAQPPPRAAAAPTNPPAAATPARLATPAATRITASTPAVRTIHQARSASTMMSAPSRAKAVSHASVSAGTTQPADAGRLAPRRLPVKPPVRVLYVGDSLAYEARGAFTSTMTSEKSVTVEQLVYGGTALCDWVTRIESAVSTWHPQAISLEFAGNAFTACMKDSATGEALTGSALIAKYMADAEQLMTFLEPMGTQVWFQGVPPMRNPVQDAQGKALNAGFAQLATQRQFTHYSYAGAALESAASPGEYVDYLPCLPVDIGSGCTDPPVTRVRALDGVHFCPVSPAATDGVTNECPVWSSGAWRFGSAMSAPIMQWYLSRLAA